MPRRLFIFSLILLVAFALRVHLLGNQELRGDEGFSWNYIQDSPGEILARIVREGDPQPPIHYWLLWGWAKMTGETEFAMRAWSALLSLSLVPLMYQTGRKLWREEVGLLAAGLTAVHPQQIWLAQDVRNMYQLALIALLVATLILPKLIHHEDTKTRRDTKRVFYWLGYVACGTFAMYSHYYALFPLMAHGAYVLGFRPHPPAPSLAVLFRRGGAGGGVWLTAGLTIAALVAPWAITILPVYSRGQLADPGSLPFTQYASAVLGDLTAGPAFPGQIKLIIAAAFFFISFFSLLSIPPHLLISLLSSLLIPFLGIYAIVALRSTFNSFYYVFAFPAAYLLFAGGLLALYKKIRPFGAFIVIVSVATFIVGLNNHYNNPQYSKTRGLRELAAHLAESAGPGDIYLANFPDPVQVYYTHKLNLSYHMLPGKANEHSDSELRQLVTGNIWFVPVNAPQWDAEAYIQNRLLQTAILSEDQRFNKMRLMLFIPPTEAEPLAATFADGIRLVGYHLAPGRLTLVWATDSVPTTDYTVFVHALASDGYNVVGHDAPPKVPTSQWGPGQLIVDVHEFDIPTDQPINLVAGMYLPSTGERLKLETVAFGEADATRVVALQP